VKQPVDPDPSDRGLSGTPQRQGARLLAALGLLLFGFAFLGSRGLLEPDEGRYTNVAAHMLRSGEYLVPALNDRTPHFTKPPLTYWAVAASTRLFGHDPWAARLPNGLAWLATVGCMVAIARRLGERSGARAGLVYGTLLLPYLAATIVTTDTLLAAFEALAVLGGIGLWRAPGHGARLALGCGLGLALLTKGPVGLLPLLAMAVALWSLGEARVMKRWLHPLVLVPFLVIGGSWFAWLAVSRPDVLGALLRSELYERVVEGRFDRHPEWYGPLRIYLPALLLGTLPWSPLVLARPRSWAAPLQRGFWRELRARDPAGLFLFVWLLLPLGLLVMVRSRLPLYLLPSFAPAALLLARRVEAGALAREPARAMLASWLLVLVATRALAAWLPLEAEPSELAQQLARQVQPAPRRIVFVDNTPLWGLGYTLDAEIEGATLRDRDDPYPPVEEVMRRPAHDRIFLVRRFAEAEFVAAARETGVRVRRRGRWDNQVFFEVVARAARMPGAP